jgi:transcription elongation factor Elf1
MSSHTCVACSACGSSGGHKRRASIQCGGCQRLLVPSLIEGVDYYGQTVMQLQRRDRT